MQTHSSSLENWTMMEEEKDKKIMQRNARHWKRRGKKAGSQQPASSRRGPTMMTADQPSDRPNEHDGATTHHFCLFFFFFLRQKSYRKSPLPPCVRHPNLLWLKVSSFYSPSYFYNFWDQLKTFQYIFLFSIKCYLSFNKKLYISCLLRLRTIQDIRKLCEKLRIFSGEYFSLNKKIF